LLAESITWERSRTNREQRMTVYDLEALAAEHLTTARAAPAGRSAVTLSHQGALRQTLIALIAGAALQDHEAPPAATLQILRGQARLTAGDDTTDLLTGGQLIAIPQRRHGLAAVNDTVVLLTVLAD
jgi:quercetin dioxygenase-like cupin family protein